MISERVLAAVDPRPAIWISYLRSQGVALTATLVDFSLVVSAVLFTGCSAAMAGALGALSGGAVSFTLNRVFAFCASQGCARRQASRYFTVWLGSLALNCGLLALGSDFLNCPIVAVKLASAILVGSCFNYPLHRAYVFDWHRAGRS